MRKKKPKAKKFPPYVWFGKPGKCAMRLMTENNGYGLRPPFYWRDGGVWGTQFREIDGKLLSCSHISSMRTLNNQELTPCTKEEWKKCNGQYAPED